jgi:hypothetical protein
MKKVKSVIKAVPVKTVLKLKKVVVTPSVSSILLEDGGNILTETGGFILTE